MDHSCTLVSAGAPPRLGLPWRELEVKEPTAVEAGIDPIDDAILNAEDWHLVAAGGWSHAEATHLLEGRIMFCCGGSVGHPVWRDTMDEGCCLWVTI